MSLERVLALALLVVSAVLLARLGPAAVRAWRIYAGTGRRRQQDASHRAPAAPPGVADRIALLASQRYRQIGVTSLTLPVGERFAWILAAEDGESYAILAGGAGAVAITGIYSAWADGTWLGTQHPLGTATDRGTLHVRIVTTTLTDAVRVHREELERLRPAHGAPRTIRSMTDMLALDADYRERFAGTRLRPLTLRIVAPAVLAATLLVLSAALLVTTAGS